MSLSFGSRASLASVATALIGLSAHAQEVRLGDVVDVRRVEVEARGGRGWMAAIEVSGTVCPRTFQTFRAVGFERGAGNSVVVTVAGSGMDQECSSPVIARFQISIEQEILGLGLDPASSAIYVVGPGFRAGPI